MTGNGIVLAEQDVAEVDRRGLALLDEMAPKTEMGAILVLHMATLSVRMERSARHEFAASAERVRNAMDDFDDRRAALANGIFEALGEDPRHNLRRLKKSPEGITLLANAWHELRSDLTRAVKPPWTAAHLIKAANLLGIREEDARGSRVGVLSDAIWGDFAGLGDKEGGALSDGQRRAWARGEVVKLIDKTFDELEEVAKSIDFARIDLDRAEAPERALFDSSRDGELARRYESEASRRFFKSLKEFREVEAEAAAREASRPTPARSAAKVPASGLGSIWESHPDFDLVPLDLAPEHLRPTSREVLSSVENLKGEDGTPIRPSRSAPKTS